MASLSLQAGGSDLGVPPLLTSFAMKKKFLILIANKANYGYESSL